MDLYVNFKNFEYYKKKRPRRSNFKHDWIFLVILAIIVGIGIIVFSSNTAQYIDKIGQASAFQAPEKSAPRYSKGIYITSWAAGDKKRMAEFIDLVKKTELNTVVIDIKDFTGKVAFDTDVKMIDELGTEELRIEDLGGLVKKLHEEDIYVIARIVVFEDPELAGKRPDLALKDKRTGKIWRTNSGMAWVDPASKEVWQYIVALSQEAARIGFDEINFDYVRFPSDGSISSISYPVWDGITPKYQVIRNFFRYLERRMCLSGVYLSADLFGLTLMKSGDDDLNVGQRLEDAVPYFDYICPMVYPSHYAKGFEGYENPAEYPYEVIYKNLVRAKQTLGPDSLSKIRPWLQDFSFGAEYTPDMVKLEKKAVYDADAYGWILWNAKNNYTEEALDRN